MGLINRKPKEGVTYMLMYDVIVIGFGKAGKTLAAKLSSQGKKSL